MVVAAVVGANWGDEGKGRLVDALAGDFSYVVRFQGGANAGHTVINDFGRFVLHTLPSGVFHPHVTNVLGPGVALDLPAFTGELAGLRASGVPEPKWLVSQRAGLLLPYQKLLDVLEEQRLDERSFGSTRSGIAPHYADRYAKRGVQVDDLFDPGRLEARITHALDMANVHLEHTYAAPRCDARAIAAEQLAYAPQLAAHSVDTSHLLRRAWLAGEDILFEGQLGALRDLDLGIYPYVTSSSPLASFALVGAGLPASALTRVIAVTKAYSSCVGAGPFVTEWYGATAEELRARGGDRGEYGATTGRPRRVGSFDAVATRYGCRIQGATEVALTCLDVLDYLDQIPVCTAYLYREQILDDFPTTRILEESTPVYEWLPGWREPIQGVTRFSQLPAAAQRYVERIEELLELPIKQISVGPAREGLIEH